MIANGTIPPRAPEVKFAPPTPLDVVLGVDFGTRFTKVCYRVLQEGDRVGVVYIPGTPTSALLRSELYLCWDDRVEILPPELGGRPSTPIPFLKMRLKSKSIGELAIAPELLHLNLTENAAALATYFLAYVFAKSRRRVLALEPRLRGPGAIEWSANVGIPAEHHDDPVSAVYRTVAAVAWQWSFDLPRLPLMAELVPWFQESSRSVGADGSPVFVFPELQATLARFARKRDTPQAQYGWMDIGGGTLDIAFFRVHRPSSSAKVHTYAARVEDLGTAKIAEAAVNLSATLSDRDRVERALVLNEDEILAGANLGTYRKKIQDTFCQTLKRAREKIPGTAFSTSPLEIFVTGGGAPSRWYRKTIEDAYVARRLDRSWGIPNLRFRFVDRPAEIMFPAKLDLGRFVVAEGLSHPFEELEDILGSSPSQIPDAGPLPTRMIKTYDYFDTKSLT